ncbi:hypothetical protein M0805_003160, partial [Coniferiporia weirii]
ADLPALTECELLALSGAFPPFDRFSHLLYPFRAPLARAGVHPRLWPDYPMALRRHARTVRDGNVLFTAFAPDDAGVVRVAGFALLALPRRAALEKKRWAERFLGDYVYPSVDAVQDKLLSGGPSGMDPGFSKVVGGAMRKGREEFANERECYILRTLVVHPNVQRRGIGSALLKHCFALADAAGVPIYLEASQAGAPLYTAHGFETIRTLQVEYAGEVVKLPVMVREPVGLAPEKNIAEGEVISTDAVLQTSASEKRE